MKKTLLKIVSLIVVLSSLNYAQDILTIERAVEIGLERNEELRKAEKELEKSDYTYREALSGAKPQITGNATYMRNLYSTSIPNSQYYMAEMGNQIIDLNNRMMEMNEMDGNIPQRPLPDQEVSAVPNNTVSMGIDINQPIYVGGKVGTAIRIAQDFKQMSELKFQAQKDETIYNIKKAYYNVIMAQKAVRILEIVKNNAQENLNNAELMFEQGLVSEYEIIRSRVQVRSVEPRLVEMQNNLAMAKDLLKTDIGINSAEEIIVSGEFDEVEKIETANIEKLVAENRKELKILQYVIDINEKNIRIERGSALPTLVAFANYKFQGQHNEFNEIFKEYGGVNAVNVGLNLSVPIYSGGRNSAKTNTAYNSMYQAELDLERTKRLLILQAKQAEKSIIQAEQELELSKLTIQEAQKALDIAKVRYQNNLSTQLEIFDAEAAYEQARMQYITAVHKFTIAKLDFKYAIGIINNTN